VRAAAVLRKRALCCAMNSAQSALSRGSRIALVVATM
jgi:hypothetical protein